MVLIARASVASKLDITASPHICNARHGARHLWQAAVAYRRERLGATRRTLQFAANVIILSRNTDVGYAGPVLVRDCGSGRGVLTPWSLPKRES